MPIEGLGTSRFFRLPTFLSPSKAKEEAKQEAPILSRTALHRAILNQDEKAIETLAKTNLVSKIDFIGQTPLDLAFYTKNRSAVEKILGLPSPLKKNFSPPSPSEYHHFSQLKKELDQLTPSILKETILCSPHKEILCQKPYTIDRQNVQKFSPEGLSPLHCAILIKDLSAIQECLKNDPHCLERQATKNGQSPMHLASLSKDPQFLKEFDRLLKGQKLGWDTPNLQGQTPLHFAAMQEHLPTLLFLSKQIDLQKADQHGISPLQLLGWSIQEKDPLALSQRESIRFITALLYWIFQGLINCYHFLPSEKTLWDLINFSLLGSEVLPNINNPDFFQAKALDWCTPFSWNLSSLYTLSQTLPTIRKTGTAFQAWNWDLRRDQTILNTCIRAFNILHTGFFLANPFSVDKNLLLNKDNCFPVDPSKQSPIALERIEREFQKTLHPNLDPSDPPLNLSCPNHAAALLHNTTIDELVTEGWDALKKKQRHLMKILHPDIQGKDFIGKAQMANKAFSTLKEIFLKQETPEI